MSRCKAEIIDPPHDLGRAIVGPGPAVMDPELLARAEAAVEALEPEFPAWAASAIHHMRVLVAAAKHDPAAGDAALASLFTVVMDLKGQAGSYGYALITSVGDRLKVFLERVETLDARAVEIIDAHVDAMDVALRDRIKGDGGALGRQVVADLRKLVPDI